MTQKRVVIYIDDMTGEESQEASPHSFSLDGVEYEIDLSPESFDKLLADFGPYLRAARRVRTPRRRKGSVTSEPQLSSEIREWARLNNHEVNARGRIPADVRAAYEAAR
ncbi:Lsr2 family protein [Streptomyces sp. NPDC004667]|uniref:histone-like nucleoid-structuring protein Lsr2 n=1 Tax=Streptomyces sp. NPDC004667 TaxID=3154285 RepID=UPI0033A68E9D